MILYDIMEYYTIYKKIIAYDTIHNNITQYIIMEKIGELCTLIKNSRYKLSTVLGFMYDTENRLPGLHFEIFEELLFDWALTKSFILDDKTDHHSISRKLESDILIHMLKDEEKDNEFIIKYDKTINNRHVVINISNKSEYINYLYMAYKYRKGTWNLNYYERVS